MIIFTMSIPNIFILNVQSADSLGRRNQKMKKMKETKTQTRVFTIRIPVLWYRFLAEQAKNECRTINSVTKQAIKEYLNKP